MVEYGLRIFGLNRIQARHLTRNPASGRVMAKIGMTHEGRLRQAVRKWGVFEDLDLWSILAGELPQMHTEKHG